MTSTMTGLFIPVTKFPRSRATDLMVLKAIGHSQNKDTIHHDEPFSVHCAICLDLCVLLSLDHILYLFRVVGSAEIFT